MIISGRGEGVGGNEIMKFWLIANDIAKCPMLEMTNKVGYSPGLCHNSSSSRSKSSGAPSSGKNSACPKQK